MMVDVERERDLLDKRRSRAHSHRVGAVEGEQHAIRSVVGQVAPQLGEVEEVVLGRAHLLPRRGT